MKEFLRQVANYYIDKAREGLDLSAYTFVFPNRRSAMFMRKYLRERYSATGFMPKLVTITSFTQDFNTSSLISQEEQLFILYKAYCQVFEEKGRADQIKDFNDFIFWGTILLKDFNDVDAYMVDYEQLFKNVHDEREIEANYLTPDQAEVARLLGDKRAVRVDLENFWKHTHGAVGKEPVDKFLSLWEILADVYRKFRSELSQRGLAYTGMLSQQAAMRIRDMEASDFKGRRFAFVGFYVLSTARTIIFQHMQKIGIAEFFWDIASPLINSDGNRAGSMVMPLSRQLKMPEDFTLEKISYIPHIDVYPIPSNMAQVKVAASILQDWAKLDKRIIDTEITSILVPNERLLMPLLYSLPEKVDDKTNVRINVALQMGYDDTPFASLLNSILIMQEHARKVKGHYQYFYKEVLEVLAHPYLQVFAPADSEAIRTEIVKSHLYNITEEEINAVAPSLQFIFKAVDNISDIEESRAYLNALLEGFCLIIPTEVRNAKGEIVESYESIILNQFRNSIAQIFTLASDYKIMMNQHTFFSLVRKMLGSLSMQFKGDPVQGVQILGLQDSRGLDFDNLIVLSLNERILPKRNITPSLIPPMLRRGYGMPTDENADIADSYQFYRLISRAKRISFIYDSRTPDLASGEKSRYITQLQLLHPDKITIKKVRAQASPGHRRVVTVSKTPEVMSQLSRLLEGGDLNISASALKTYINCPLQFYLQNVRGMRTENFDPEYMDPASYGSVLHRVAELFYKDFRTSPSANPLIKADTLKDYFSSPAKEKALTSHLTQMVLEGMNDLYYNHKYDGRLHAIPGEGRVLARIMAKYIKIMLRCESQQRDFVFVEGEEKLGKKRHVWELTPELKINFTLSIDRIDQLDDDGQHLRFIDYKTGSDEMTASSVEELFSNHKKGAIFQLMIYCIAYSELTGKDVAIMPMIYRFTSMAKDGLKPISISKKKVYDYRQFDGDEPFSLRNEVRERLVELISEIFDPEKPFTQAEDSDMCKFCPFIDLCGRYSAIDDE